MQKRRSAIESPEKTISRSLLSKFYQYLKLEDLKNYAYKNENF